MAAITGGRQYFTKYCWTIMQVENGTLVSFEFDFIEPDKKGEYQSQKVNILPEDIETVTQQITTRGNEYSSMIFIQVAAKQIATGAIL